MTELICVICGKEADPAESRHTSIGIVCPICFPTYEKVEILLVPVLKERYTEAIKKTLRFQ